MSKSDSDRIFVRLTPTQMALLDAKADGVGITRNQYIRELLVSHLIGHDEYRMALSMHRMMAMSAQLAKLYVDRFGVEDLKRANQAASEKSAAVFGRLIPRPWDLPVDRTDVDNLRALHALLDGV